MRVRTKRMRAPIGAPQRAKVCAALAVADLTRAPTLKPSGPKALRKSSSPVSRYPRSADSASTTPTSIGRSFPITGVAMHKSKFSQRGRPVDPQGHFHCKILVRNATAERRPGNRWRAVLRAHLLATLIRFHLDNNAITAASDGLITVGYHHPRQRTDLSALLRNPLLPPPATGTAGGPRHKWWVRPIYVGSIAVTARLQRSCRSSGIRPSTAITAITHHATRNAAI
jgi:hypothetical protein